MYICSNGPDREITVAPFPVWFSTLTGTVASHTYATSSILVSAFNLRLQGAFNDNAHFKATYQLGILRVRYLDIPTQIIHHAPILTTAGLSGFQPYTVGQTASLVFFVLQCSIFTSSYLFINHQPLSCDRGQRHRHRSRRQG